MTLVVKEGETWCSVAVHRAVIMPLFHFLKEMEKDVTKKEDPVVILPDVPLELLESLIRLVYEGFAPMSEVVTVDNLLLLMRMLGLNLPVERLVVTVEKVEEEVEIVGFKNKYGALDIFEVKAGRERESLPLNNERRRSLVITPCGSSATKENKKRRLFGQERRRHSQVLGRSAKSRDSSVVISDVNDNLKPNAEIVEDVGDINVAMMTLDVKLVECEEVEDTSQRKSRKRKCKGGDISDSSTMKRRYIRRRESLDAPMLACELCDFKCRFVKDMQKHYDADCSNENLCMLCGFTASTRGGLRVHSARKHSMGKNKAKLVEGVFKRAEEEPVAPIDETVTNNDCEENLVIDVITREEDYQVDDKNDAVMTLECINGNEPVKEIVGIETESSMDNFSSNTNAPCLDAAESAKARPIDESENLKCTDNCFQTSFKLTQAGSVDIGKSDLLDDCVNKTVENNPAINAVQAILDGCDGISVEVVNKGKCTKKLGQNEDDPLTILKNVKAAHSMGRLKMPKGGGNKKVKPKARIEAKKGGIEDEKEFGTADDKTVKTEEC